jgi:hypothetical protein
MARSHVGFEQLSEPGKQYYEKQVGVLQAEAEKAKASDIAECQEQLALMVQKQQQADADEAARGPPLTLSACRLSETDVNNISNSIDGEDD